MRVKNRQFRRYINGILRNSPCFLSHKFLVTIGNIFSMLVNFTLIKDYFMDNSEIMGNEITQERIRLIEYSPSENTFEFLIDIL